MFAKTKTLRKFTIGIQLIAGFGLLTASYLTTEQGWSNELEAAFYTIDPARTDPIKSLKAGYKC